FMGGELGNPAEWDEGTQIPWELVDDPLHGGIQRLVGDVNRIYRATPALYEQDFTPEGFSWIDANDSDSNVLALLRWSADGVPLACIANFSAMPHEDYRVGLPRAGIWRETLNTDAEVYGGSGVGNLGRVSADGPGHHGQDYSAALAVPPLGTIWLTPDDTE